MFTGIIEELGQVRTIVPRADGARIEIEATKVLDETDVGASIAVNGCCLTVVERGDDYWVADVVAESLKRTNLGSLVPGDPVNLERPVRVSDRLDGHIVQGHVDGVARISARETQSDGSVLVQFDASVDLLRYVVHKGSIAVDGVSLTVVAFHDGGFSVAVIPHTLEVTTLGTKTVGNTVNLEADVLAKYVERLLPSGEAAEASATRKQEKT
ncbi:MAG: riboflavin synthase [Actinomycetota bacterium]|nr:riboflavin synthase [Actinomycetota bacterium]